GVDRVAFNWVWGRWLMGGPTSLMTRVHIYGRERIPDSGGVVVAFNHFHWIDIPVYGWATTRPLYFLAKAEAHAVPVAGAYLRMFGSFAVRRGESDREAMRRMREVVRDGHMLGIFAEGTRQRNGVPGPVQPGAAMVALNEGVPVLCAAIYGSQRWNWNLAPVSVAFAEPMRLEGLPAGSKGYRAASEQIEAKLHELWSWLRKLHEGGRRPRRATPPA
ncbi:MAG: lysophospholipid acyltransferase family protein, partial [Gaiellaceae bacterium]